MLFCFSSFLLNSPFLPSIPSPPYQGQTDVCAHLHTHALLPSLLSPVVLCLGWTLFQKIQLREDAGDSLVGSQRWPRGPGLSLCCSALITVALKQFTKLFQMKAHIYSHHSPSPICHHTHFIDEEAKAQRGQMSCPRSRSWRDVNPALPWAALGAIGRSLFRRKGAEPVLQPLDSQTLTCLTCFEVLLCSWSACVNPPKDGQRGPDLLPEGFGTHLVIFWLRAPALLFGNGHISVVVFPGHAAQVGKTASPGNRGHCC